MCGMTAHSYQDEGENSSKLPNVVPFDLPSVIRIHWELGERIVKGADPTLHSKWEQRRASWTLSIFQVASPIVLICIFTPVRRKQFYKVTQSNLNSILSKLVSAPHWHQCAWLYLSTYTVNSFVRSWRLAQKGKQTYRLSYKRLKMRHRNRKSYPQRSRQAWLSGAVHQLFEGE